MTKNKLIIIRHRFLFIGVQLDIYDDKNMWNVIYSRTPFIREAEKLLDLAYRFHYERQGD